MSPDQIRDVLDRHARWRRGESDGTRANLTCANLAGANLTGAYLTGANLAGAKIAAGEIARFMSGGWLRSYGWNALVMRDGATRLRYGCEEHALAEWPALLRELCKKHVANEVEAYERDLTALLAFVGSLAANK